VLFISNIPYRDYFRHFSVSIDGYRAGSHAEDVPGNHIFKKEVGCKTIVWKDLDPKEG
jgi:hypothetical protein